MKFEKIPKIIFKAEAFEKMMEYARAAEGEISGFSTVEERGDHYYITETYIMPQKASGGGVLINADTLHDFMEWCNENGHPERPAKARLWWHSHANFNVFRSSTDTGTVALLRQVMPYLICMVVNKQRQYEITLYEKTHTITGIKAIKEDQKAVLRAAVEREVAEMVKPWTHGVDEHEDERPTVMPYSYGMSAEDLYLIGLEKGEKEIGPGGHEVKRSETPWQKYMREKGLLAKEQTDKEAQTAKADKPIHEMTDEEWQAYCRQENVEPLLDPQENDDDTKRWVVEEGIIRPDVKERE